MTKASTLARPRPNKKLSYFAAAVVLLLSWPLTGLGGPPDISDALPDSELEKLDSLTEAAERLQLQAEKLRLNGQGLALKLDSLSRIDVQIFDTAGLPSFAKIIIENGVIKVLTDSGLIVLNPTETDSLWPYAPLGTSEKNRELTSWGKSIVVDEGERVPADIIVISGDATVKGSVDGDVLVIGGDIFVNATGYIKGDAIAIGGRVKKEDGAKVVGSTFTLSLPLMVLPRGSVFQIIQAVMLLGLILGIFFSAMSISLFPRPILRISGKLSTNPIKSFFLGYATYLGLFLIWILLLVSVIGIPLAFFGEPVAFLIVVIFAYTAVNLIIGEKLFKEKASFKAFWYGCLATTGAPFVLLLTGYLTNSLVLFVLNMVFLGLLLFVILPFGLGGALLARFGLPARVRKHEEALPASAEAATRQSP